VRLVEIFTRLEGVVVGVLMDDAVNAAGLIAVEVSNDLAAMVRRFPLPHAVQDADMNQEELAAALSTTVNTLGKWIKNDGMPVAQAGGLGKPYILRLSHCWAWKRAREAEQDDRSRHNKDQIARLQAEFLGLDVDSPLSQMSAKQRRELADADIAYSRAKQMRRQLLQLDDVVELLESLFATMRDGIEAMPDRLERELSLRPEEVAIVQRVGSDVLTAMAERIEEAELRDQDVEAVEVQRQWTI
jgi:hypothetical protein